MPEATQAVQPVGDSGTDKRSIQMKLFTSKSQKLDVAAAFERDASLDKTAAKHSVTLGQIVGAIYAVKEQVFEVKGVTSKALVAIGQFEAIVYGTGEIMTAGMAYLPGYFLEQAQALLEKGTESLLFAVEIVLVPTGKEIPVAYEVRNLRAPEPDSPMARLKAELAATGKLRLPQAKSATAQIVDQRDETADAEAAEEATKAKAGHKAKATA